MCLIGDLARRFVNQYPHTGLLMLGFTISRIFGDFQQPQLQIVVLTTFTPITHNRLLIAFDPEHRGN